MNVDLVIPSALDDERLDRVVAVITELPRSQVAMLVESGAVTVDGRVVTKASLKVRLDQHLSVAVKDPETVGLTGDSSVPFTVLYEDPDLAVIEKPAGVVVHPGAGTEFSTLAHGLVARYPELAATVPGNDPLRPGIVHRLDAGTSGLLVVARTSAAHTALVAALQARDIERRYLTLLWGHLDPPVGMVDAPIGRSQNERTKMAVSSAGKDARTRYQVLAHRNDPAVSWVAVKLETGRTHQIRVHMMAIGHPVVGDRRYGGAREGLELHRPFLHAHELRFAHPLSGEPLHFRSALPEDLRAMVHLLGLDAEVPEVEVDELEGGHSGDEGDEAD